MTSEWRQALEVARWEFRRFVKPKQLLASLILTLVAGGIGYGMARLAGRSGESRATLAVIGGDALDLGGASGDGITFVGHPATARDSLASAVGARSLDGLVVVKSIDSVELVVARDRPWRSRLEARLSDARRQIKLREADLPASGLADLLAPVRVDLRLQDPSRGRGARWVAIVSIVVVLYGVFTAAAYIFVSITGEKQLRVTEQVMSIIHPQPWIDGKIIGIAGVSIVSLMTMGLGVLLFFVGRAIARQSWSMPAVVGDPMTFFWILLFAALGFMFWLAFLGAVAATIDDPNTSTRAPVIFLPAFFASAGIFIIRNPDSTLSRVTALIPLTSPAAMPARLALTDVTSWEIALALVFLIASIWLMRVAAGRIFAVGMLMFGKEAGWREIARWARRR